MRHRRTLAVLVLGLLALVVHATCGGNPSSPTPPPASSAISLQILGQTALTSPGQTSQLNTTAAFQDGRLDVVTSRTTWTSGDQSVATISPSGLLTAVGYGRTQILADFQGQSAFVDVKVLPDGTFILNGTVTEAGGLAIEGATISLSGGTVSGSRSTTADGGGFFHFAGVSGAITISVTNAGYVREEKTVTISSDSDVNIELTPKNPPANIAGNYQLTVTASPSCSGLLPAAARKRTYGANLDQSGASVHATLSGADFIETGGGYYPPRLSNAFAGRVLGKQVTFELLSSGGYFYGERFDIAEKLGDQYLAISGTAETSVSGAKISGPLVGEIDIFNSFPERRRPDITCTADDHRFVFTK